jgi:hypothetical protein
MKASSGILEQAEDLPVSKIPALMQVPEWEQFPLEKRSELVQVLAGMLVRQAQEQWVKHEQPS